MNIDANPNELWENDSIQFARLISEMEAIGVFNDNIMTALGEEMDLSVNDICQLIDRAQCSFEHSKEMLRKLNL